MKKNLLITLGVILGISFLLNIVQLIYSSYKGREVNRLESSLVQVSEKADTLSLQNEELSLNVTDLEVTNRHLEDSLSTLNQIIQKLRRRVGSYNSRLKDMQEAMAYLKQREADLQQQASLAADIQDDPRIQELTDEKAALNQKIRLLENKADSLLTVKEALYDQVTAKEMERQQYMKRDAISQKTLDIIQNTTVEFFEVKPLKKNKKHAKSAKKWYETVINCSLNYDNPSDLNGRAFLLRIVDAATGQVLSPQESSLKDTPGVSFAFNGNPVPEIEYSNYEKKSGKQYIVQILLMNNGQTYLLNDGSAAVEFK